MMKHEISLELKQNANLNAEALKIARRKLMELINGVDESSDIDTLVRYHLTLQFHDLGRKLYNACR